MKRCPQCGQTYSDDNSFCFDDGTSLVFVSSGVPHQSYTTADVPTQVIPRTTQTTETRTGGSPLLYVLVGVLATALAAMGFFIWWSRDTGPETTSNTSSASTPERSNANASPAPAPSNSMPAKAADATPLPVIDFEQIRSDVLVRLSKWEHDGEARDGYAVVTNYTDSVTYYRRSNTRRDFIQRDKSRAYSKFDSIDITLSNISVTPTPDGNAARVVLDKAYVFGGAQRLEGKVKQEIGLVRVGGEWLINSERDISVYYQTK